MLYYISTADLPGKQANTVQQVRMCEAFQRAGVDVCLVHPGYGDLRERVTWDDLSAFYGLGTRFEVRTVPTLKGRFETVPQIGLLSMLGAVTANLVRQLLREGLDGDDIVYGRNYYGMFPFNELRQLLPPGRKPTVAFEMHTPISAHLKPRFFRSVDGIVSITHALQWYVQHRYGLDEERMLVAPDGVDLRPYAGLTGADARDRLGLSHDETLVAYTGHLYAGKGVETLVEAAEDIDATVYVVGGYDEDIERVKAAVGHPENVVFTGFVEPSAIPRYQLAADVLVAPYTEDSRPWVSPLKLFEYMAAGRPIVASDREVLREVLVDGENAVLFEMGDVEGFRQAIERVLADDRLAGRLAERARRDVEQYTWKRRAERILSFVEERESDRRA